WNIRSPYWRRSTSISSRAAGVKQTRATKAASEGPEAGSRIRPRASAAGCGCARSEEAERLGTIAHQHVLGLLVMVEHHLVRLAPDPRLLVAPERGMGRIQVKAVGPDAASLQAPTEPVRAVDIARPNTRAEPVQRVVGDRHRLVGVLERRHRHHRPEDLLLEDPHLVVATEHGGLHVVALLE